MATRGLQSLSLRCPPSVLATFGYSFGPGWFFHAHAVAISILLRLLPKILRMQLRITYSFAVLPIHNMLAEILRFIPDVVSPEVSW